MSKQDPTWMIDWDAELRAMTTPAPKVVRDPISGKRRPAPGTGQDPYGNRWVYPIRRQFVIDALYGRGVRCPGWMNPATLWRHWSETSSMRQWQYPEYE